MQVGVMKRVRKGRYHVGKEREEIENIILDLALPGWYLLPKAHSVEQLLVDLTCAWCWICFLKAFNCYMDFYRSAWGRRCELSPFKFVDESSPDLL